MDRKREWNFNAKPVSGCRMVTSDFFPEEAWCPKLLPVYL